MHEKVWNKSEIGRGLERAKDIIRNKVLEEKSTPLSLYHLLTTPTTFAGNEYTEPGQEHKSAFEAKVPSVLVSELL